MFPSYSPYLLEGGRTGRSGESERATFLLVKVSVVAMLDAHLAATRPNYLAYSRRTSAFVPPPPRG
jgi:hypothetical protein